jgi:hypothetical protein
MDGVWVDFICFEYNINTNELWETDFWYTHETPFKSIYEFVAESKKKLNGLQISPIWT